MSKPRLTPKQRRFVQEYLADENMNATGAYRRAYPACKSDAAASVCASRLLSSAKVKAAVAAAQAERSERLRLKADDVVRELALLAFADIGEVLDFTGESLKLRRPEDIKEGARRALQSVKTRRFTEGHGDQARTVEVVEFRLADKRAALVDLGRHLGMFADRVEHSGTVRVVAAAELPDDRLAAIAVGLDGE